MTIKIFAFFNVTGVKNFFKLDKIFKDLSFLSEIINILFIFLTGALGQTRTGTPKRARILSPLCLPISPRGHVVIFVVIVNILIHKSFK